MTLYASSIHKCPKLETIQMTFVQGGGGAADEWINKLQYIHTMEHGSALKGKKALIRKTFG